jgi:hypothetical protein
MEFRVKSLRVEKFIDYDDDNEESFENERYVLNCETGKGGNSDKWEVILWTTYGECYSGWCAATWANAEIRKVDNFVGMTHKPIKDLKFELDINDDYSATQSQGLDSVENEIFTVYDDGDYYYPSGEATVNMKLFKEINRNKDVHPVWIFYGNSNLGKTYLAQIIGNSGYYKQVYETDSSETLPDNITDDIIVVGNKYKFKLEDIEKHILNPHETILVNFKNSMKL